MVGRPPMRTALVAVVALVAAARSSAAQSTPERAEPGAFLAVAIGGAEQGDAPPGLVAGALGLVGHIEAGWTDGRYLAGGLTLGMTRTSYDNLIPPPEGIVADPDLRLTRVAFGAAGDVRLPLGSLAPSVGGAIHLDRSAATARGSLFGITGDYFSESDIGFGFDVRAGLDLRVHRTTWIGLRGGWTWFRADLEGVTSDGDWLGGPFAELRVTFDMSGFRMASTPVPPPRAH